MTHLPQWMAVPTVVAMLASGCLALSPGVASASSTVAPSMGQHRVARAGGLRMDPPMVPSSDVRLSCDSFFAGEDSLSPESALEMFDRAAQLAAVAARSDAAWNSAARVMAAITDLPAAMLTPTQEDQWAADTKTATADCSGIGARRIDAPDQITPHPLNANVRTVWDYLTSHTSLTLIQVAGLVGNLMDESYELPVGAMNPEASECGDTLVAPPAGYCGVGIAQWTWTGEDTDRWGGVGDPGHLRWGQGELWSDEPC
jgi:hypothetical protein